MNIEESAFKDRKTLANLNTIDLLDIIEFLQLDRKQWINQFIKTHNESIDIQKENQEFKKQLEVKKIIARNWEVDCKRNISEVEEKETQQKEFINYLEKEIKRINPNDLYIGELNLRLDDIKFTQYLIYKEILQKYKSIIGVSNEKEN